MCNKGVPLDFSPLNPWSFSVILMLWGFWVYKTHVWIGFIWQCRFHIFYSIHFSI